MSQSKVPPLPPPKPGGGDSQKGPPTIRGTEHPAALTNRSGTVSDPAPPTRLMSPTDYQQPWPPESESRRFVNMAGLVDGGRLARGGESGQAVCHSEIWQSEGESWDPGDTWLPLALKNTTKQNLQHVLQDSALLNALTNTPGTLHPSLDDCYQAVSVVLDENMRTASQLIDLEAQLCRQRENTQAQLLSAHALERQWQQKQRDMDNALNPFSPSVLYQKIGQGLLEQDGLCSSLENCFLEGSIGGELRDSGFALEREVLEWTRRYKDQKKLYHLRKERRARWDEGRVGGWR